MSIEEMKYLLAFENTLVIMGYTNMPPQDSLCRRCFPCYTVTLTIRVSLYIPLCLCQPVLDGVMASLCLFSSVMCAFLYGNGKIHCEPKHTV